MAASAATVLGFSVRLRCFGVSMAVCLLPLSLRTHQSTSLKLENEKLCEKRSNTQLTCEVEVAAGKELCEGSTADGGAALRPGHGGGRRAQSPAAQSHPGTHAHPPYTPSPAHSNRGVGWRGFGYGREPWGLAALTRHSGRCDPHLRAKKQLPVCPKKSLHFITDSQTYKKDRQNEYKNK